MSPAAIEAAGCLTVFGDSAASYRALAGGRCGLALTPVLGADGGDPVPLALWSGRGLGENIPPGWMGALAPLASAIPSAPWGSPRYPVFVTSSNFGVGSLYAFHRGGDARHLPYATPERAVEALRRSLGWAEDVTIFSHACVSAHLGLIAGAQALENGGAEKALVFSFDLLSPFVAGGFHALKILNGGMPAPFARRPAGAIGLGDGAAFAVLGPGPGEFTLEAHSLHNEMRHFTANDAEGAGFAACFAPLAERAAGRRLWIKAHGTGTLDSGRLEAEACARHWPGAPIVSWKGSLGHTLGSCGLVELAIALEALRAGLIPGTVGTTGPCFADEVATAPFSSRDRDGVLFASNAFGGAHAAFLLRHD